MTEENEQEWTEEEWMDGQPRTEEWTYGQEEWTDGQPRTEDEQEELEGE